MKNIIALSILSLSFFTGFGQANNALHTTLSAITDIREKLPVEKLYLQTDKPYYIAGDTLRFKSYLLNADFLTPSLRSGLLYVELDNVAGRMVKRIMVPLASGISWGGMALNEENDISTGTYTLRAYTNWMRNFGEDYIFKKNIYISPMSGGATLIKTAFRLDSLNGRNKVSASLRFSGLDQDALRLQDMQLRVKAGKRTLFSDKVATGMDGSMDINFDLADKTLLKGLVIQAQNISKGADTATLTIPVTIIRLDNTDLQFMPEGGSLVAGITTKVGFKAVGENGKGMPVSGKVYNSTGAQVAAFSTLHAGMGSFDFTPNSGESYTAKLDLPKGISRAYTLPKVNLNGTTLKVIAKGNDSLEVTIAITAGTITTDHYYLIGTARGVMCYAAAFNFNKNIVKQRISRNAFPTGIAHFTLLTGSNQPLNERLIYIDHHDNLKINITSQNIAYTIRDSIALDVAVTDKEGKPVSGTFSMAVTDDSQVRTDSLNSNILNNLLLTSDLKGTVEEPGWYFENSSPEHLKALDNLLLTQGWVGYDWKSIFTAASQPLFLAEKEFIVEGKVTNIFNKPVENSGIVLFSQKPATVLDTVTDKGGHFIFKGLYPIDTAIFKIQARNKQAKSFNVGIEMLNEFKPPVFSASNATLPWYVNSDTLLLKNNASKQAQIKAESSYRGEGNVLKEVVIKDRKIIKDSHNLNGPGESDQTIDEKEILKAGKMNLGELIAHTIPGFIIKGKCPYCHKKISSYIIKDQSIHLVFDGVDVNKGIPLHDPEHYGIMKDLMDYFTAEDIKGIEVMSNSAYAGNYAYVLLGATSSLPPIVFLEVTTRSGHGPWMKTTPGTYLYKPLPFSLAKDFYRPRYTINNVNTAMGTDLRSTIHWEPNLVTDTNGRATVSFFSADKPATYSVIVEGTDLEGSIGYSRQKIRVTAKPVSTK